MSSGERILPKGQKMPGKEALRRMIDAEVEGRLKFEVHERVIAEIKRLGIEAKLRLEEFQRERDALNVERDALRSRLARLEHLENVVLAYCQYLGDVTQPITRDRQEAHWANIINALKLCGETNGRTT
jgi:hypothetical protein